MESEYYNWKKERELAKDKFRTLFYRRVSWTQGDNLQRQLSKAHESLATTEDRTFAHGDGEIQGMVVDDGTTGLFIHIWFPCSRVGIHTVLSQSPGMRSHRDGGNE